MADLLSAISVLLVFLTFLFNEIEREVIIQIKLSTPPKAQVEARKQFKCNILRLILLKVLPVTLIYIVTFYSILPNTVKIINDSRISFWEFDALNTIFVFIEIGLFGLTIFALTRLIQLFNKYKEDK